MRHLFVCLKKRHLLRYSDAGKAEVSHPIHPHRHEKHGLPIRLMRNPEQNCDVGRGLARAGAAQ